MKNRPVSVRFPLQRDYLALPSNAVVLCPLCRTSVPVLHLPKHIRGRHRRDPYADEPAERYVGRPLP